MLGAGWGQGVITSHCRGVCFSYFSLPASLLLPVVHTKGHAAVPAALLLEFTRG